MRTTLAEWDLQLISKGGGRLAQSEEHVTPGLRILSSSPTLGIEIPSTKPNKVEGLLARILPHSFCRGQESPSGHTHAVQNSC